MSSEPRLIGAEELRDRLPIAAAVEALEAAFASTDPSGGPLRTHLETPNGSLLLMDEPSMGLAPILVEQVFEIIKTIRSLGRTVFVVEQNANMALSIADRGYVIQTGQVVLADTAQNLLDNPLMREAYLGEL